LALENLSGAFIQLSNSLVISKGGVHVKADDLDAVPAERSVGLVKQNRLTTSGTTMGMSWWIS
jgi:hypothetical protein